MSVWSSITCPKCKGGEMSVAHCFNWLRFSCSEEKCGISFVIVLPEESVNEIFRQLKKKVTRRVFESDYEGAVRKLIGKKKHKMKYHKKVRR